MNYLLLSLGLCTLFLLSNAISLLKNYFKARQTGLPIVINPFNLYNPLWLVLTPTFQKAAAKWLPNSIYRLIRCGIHGHDFIEGWNQYKDLGSSTYVYVSASVVDVQSADPEFLDQVWGWKLGGFCIDPMQAQLLGCHGHNLFTVEGRDWQRQRRLIAPLLNEKISDVVWTESIKQANQMLDWLETNHELTTNTLSNGLKTIAINVLGAAGYGLFQSWAPPRDIPSNNSTSQRFFDSVSLQTQYFILGALAPVRILGLPFMPIEWQKLATAKLNFHRYAQDLINEEKASQALNSIVKTNFMAMLVKALEHEDTASEKESREQKKNTLSSNEIQGNLFVFSVAGFDTTANTLAYATVLLAIYPDWQEWLIEEIDTVADEDLDQLYSTTFPKLLRCLAFLFEVLRLYTPVGHTSRVLTSEHVVTLPTSGITYKLPAGLNFTFANQAVHLNPAIYGPNAEEFDPGRWISADNSNAVNKNENLMVHPPKATFVPWSYGPRSCPGMKMAQVEFVAVIFSILKRYRIIPSTRNEGEGVENAKETLKGCMLDSRQRVTLAMNRPQDVWLSLERR